MLCKNNSKLYFNINLQPVAACTVVVVVVGGGDVVVVVVVVVVKPIFRRRSFALNKKLRRSEKKLDFDFGLSSLFS